MSCFVSLRTELGLVSVTRLLSISTVDKLVTSFDSFRDLTFGGRRKNSRNMVEYSPLDRCWLFLPVESRELTLLSNRRALMTFPPAFTHSLSNACGKAVEECWDMFIKRRLFDNGCWNTEEHAVKCFASSRQSQDRPWARNYSKWNDTCLSCPEIWFIQKGWRRWE